MPDFLDKYDKERLRSLFPNNVNFGDEDTSDSPIPVMGDSSDSQPVPFDGAPSLITQDQIKSMQSSAKPAQQIPLAPVSMLDNSTPIESGTNDLGSMDRLMKAQQDRRDNLKGADINEFLGMAGQALGRQKTNLVTPFANRQREQAGLELKEQQEQIANEENDPKSSISQIARERLFKAMPELKDKPGYENATAAQLKKLGVKFQQDQAKALQQARYQDEDGNIRIGKWDGKLGLVRDPSDAIAGFAQDLRTDPYTGEVMKNSKASGGVGQRKITGAPGLPSLNKAEEGKKVTQDDKDADDAFNLRNQLNPVQRKSVEDNNDAFLKDTGKARDAVTAAQNVRNLLNAPKEGKLDQDVLRAIQNQLSRGAGEVGAMTENDVAPFGGRGTLKGRIERMFAMNSVGQLPDEDRRMLMQLSKVMESSAQKGITSQSKIYQHNISRNTGLPLDQASKLLGVNSAAMIPEQEETVKVKNRDGRVGELPKSKLKEALEHGFTLVE